MTDSPAESRAGVSGAWSPATDWLASVTGLDKADMQNAFGPELTASLIQAPIDIGLSRISAAAAHALLGLAFFGMAWKGSPNRRQAQRDFLELSAHFFNRSVTLRPEDIAQMMVELQALRSGIAEGSAESVRRALIRTPDDVTSLIRAIQVQGQSLGAPAIGPRFAPKPAPVVAKANPTPVVAPPPPAGQMSKRPGTIY